MKITMRLASFLLLTGLNLHASLLSTYLNYDRIVKQKSLLSQKMLQSGFEESFFESARLTINVDDFEDFSKRYALRMYVNDPRRLKLEQAFFNHRKEYYQRMQKAAADTILQKRYQLLFEAAKEKRLLKILQQERTLYKSYIQYLLVEMSENSRLETLQNVRTKLLKIEDRYTETLSRYREKLFSIAAALADSTLMQVDDAIAQFVRKNSMPPINRISSLKLFYDPKKDPALLDKEERIVKERFALKSVKASLKPKIDNIDLQYRQSQPLDRGLRAGISFRLPLASKDATLLEKEIALKKAVIDHKKAISTQQLKNVTAKNRILQNISRYRRVEKSLPASSQSIDISDESQIRSFVKKRMWEFTLREEMTDITYQIASDLLQILYRSGELTKKGSIFWQL